MQITTNVQLPGIDPSTNIKCSLPRSILSRTASFELYQAIKFKTTLSDENLLILVQFVLQDAGGTLTPSVLTENIRSNTEADIESMSTSAAECMRQYVQDTIEFVSDVHTLSKVKSTFGSGVNQVRLNEETLGGHLKAAFAQWLSLEITKSNSRDHKAITKFLPWLYTLPSVQTG